MTTITQPGLRVRSRVGNVALWVLQVATAALLALGAYSKLSSDPLAVAGFDDIGAGQWLRYFVGFAEVAGAIGLLVPVLSGLASIGLIALLVGAIAITIALHPIGVAALPVGTLLVVAIIAWGRRDTLGRLLRLLSKKS